MKFVKNGLLIGLCLFFGGAVAMEVKQKAVSAQEGSAVQWPGMPDAEIKKLIQQELDAPRSLNPDDSPIHASIARMVKTYNELWPAVAKENEVFVEWSQAYEKFEQANKKWEDEVTEWQKKEIPSLPKQPEPPRFPIISNPVLGWADVMPTRERMLLVVKLVRDSLKAYPDLNKKLVYISVGAGALLQDVLIAQELLYAGYKDLILNFTVEPKGLLDQESEKENISILLAQFDKRLAAVQQRVQSRGVHAVHIETRPYDSVDEYINKRPKNEKFDLLTIVDLQPFSSHELASLSPYINEVEVQLYKGIRMAHYFLEFPKGRPNFAYAQQKEETELDETLKKIIQTIVRDNIRSGDQIKKMLSTAQEEASRYGMSLSIRFGANPYNDLERLCAYADDSAVLYYLNKAVVVGTSMFESGPEGLVDTRRINPKSFISDEVLVPFFENEGFKRIKP